MKLKTYTKCKDCESCIDLYNNGKFYCNIKINDIKNKEQDVSTCMIDPDSKPENCPWDKIAETINTLSQEDKIGIKCLMKMFSWNKEWFDEELICKNCKYYEYYGLSNDTVSECMLNHIENPAEDWYCADWEMMKQ